MFLIFRQNKQLSYNPIPPSSQCGKISTFEDINVM